ncbi:hypothetical protein Acsp04_40370 [Actinomadura sp. NBRC 104425]|nr:hypothetical protein Acsp04_40370 [Actinomadura sp. NBRC 104425]
MAFSLGTAAGSFAASAVRGFAAIRERVPPRTGMAAVRFRCGRPADAATWPNAVPTGPSDGGAATRLNAMSPSPVPGSAAWPKPTRELAADAGRQASGPLGRLAVQQRDSHPVVVGV